MVYICVDPQKLGEISFGVCHYRPLPVSSASTGADFTNRLKLRQLSLCVRFKPKNRLKSVSEIGPWSANHISRSGFIRLLWKHCIKKLCLAFTSKKHHYWQQTLLTWFKSKHPKARIVSFFHAFHWNVHQKFAMEKYIQ